jgi:hypothetical protein
VNDCLQCNDKGVIRLRYEDGSPDDFAICLCEAARWFRSSQNGRGRHNDIPCWELWAAANGIDREHVALVEEFLEPDEIAARFPWLVDTEPEPTSSVSAITDAMRTQPRPRL